jgi:hypothetical protein
MTKFLFFVIFLASHAAFAGIFDSKQGMVFQTKGEAVVLKNSTFTTGIERKISIPQIVDVREQAEFANLRHDSDSGWTRCRVPLKGEWGITGKTERSLVFECRPLQYFPK